MAQLALQGDAMWQTKLAEGSKTLVLTVWTGKPQLLTVEQASQLSLPEFGNLWQVVSQTAFHIVSHVVWHVEKLDSSLCASHTLCLMKHCIAACGPTFTATLHIVPQEYVKKLGACLLDGKQGLDGGLSDSVSSKLNKWAAEATSLMVCMALRNPWAVRAFNAAVDASQLPGRTCAGQWQNSNLLVKPTLCIGSSHRTHVATQSS